MPPLLALTVCALAVCGVLALDSRRTANLSRALWIPVAWTAILASRPLVQWFDPSVAAFGADVEAGSAIDRNVLAALMAGGVAVLIKRRFAILQWIKVNPWVFAFIIYCGISVVWSDFPAIGLKRWIRALGGMIMILVVLSETDPVVAVTAVVRRCAYVLVPVSIVFIKYVRDLGVGHNIWTGQEFLVGVTTDKNALGRLCLVAALFGFWQLIVARQGKGTQKDRLGWWVGGGFWLMTMWLLWKSNSATSLACVVLGSAVCAALGLSGVRKRCAQLVVVGVLVAAAAAVLGLSTNVAELTVSRLGRDLTLTDRTLIWRDLLAMNTNPLIGVGYDTFWLGERREQFVEVHTVDEAHNGYLEAYLELGAVGLFLLAGVVLSAFARALQSLATESPYGRLRMAFLVVFLAYNFTESGYKATTFICFVFLMVAIEAPATLRATAPAPARARALRYGRAKLGTQWATVTPAPVNNGWRRRMSATAPANPARRRWQ